MYDSLSKYGLQRKLIGLETFLTFGGLPQVVRVCEAPGYLNFISHPAIYVCFYYKVTIISDFFRFLKSIVIKSEQRVWEYKENEFQISDKLSCNIALL